MERLGSGTRTSHQSCRRDWAGSTSQRLHAERPPRAVSGVGTQLPNGHGAPSTSADLRQRIETREHPRRATANPALGIGGASGVPRGGLCQGRLDPTGP